MDFLWIEFVSLCLTAFYTAVFSDPCTSYDTLSGEVKRSSAYILPNASATAICDTFLEEKWYRINSTVGNDIVQTCQSMTHCGTMFPLWMNGTLPLVSDGEVDRMVCQSGILGCCETSLTIKLRNCGTFFIYFLRKPSGCPVSYCFGTQPINSTDVTTTSLQTPDETTIQTTDETTIQITDAYTTDVGSDIKDPEIVGIVLGVVFGVLLPGITIFFCIYSHQKKKSRVGPFHVYQLYDVENQVSPKTQSEKYSSTHKIQNTDLRQNQAGEDSKKSEIQKPDCEQNKDREETNLSMKDDSPSIFPFIKPRKNKRIRN